MNFRTVLRAYSLLRQLTDDESALLETLRTMNETERELLVGALQPEQPTTTTAPRKIEHCEVCDYTRRARVHKDATADGYHEFQSSAGKVKKSKRASSLAEQIKGTTSTKKDDDEPDIFDTIAERRQQICGTCGNYEEYVDHHQPSPNYHPFQPPASTAERSSSANGGGVSSTQNSGTQPEGVSPVAREASGGD